MNSEYSSSEIMAHYAGDAGNVSVLKVINSDNPSLQSTDEDRQLLVPNYMSTFLKLGTGQYVISPQPSTTTNVDLPVNSEIQNLDQILAPATLCQNTKETPLVNSDNQYLDQIIEPDKPNQNLIENREPAREPVGDTDIWANLKAVAHRFKSNLQVLLTSDLRGREFMSALRNLQKINYSLIASILIDSEVKDNPDKRIPRDLFLNWARDLVILIPSTHVDVWYRPYSRTNDGRQCAGGVLYQKYNNRRKTYRQIGLLKSESRKNQLATSTGHIINVPSVAEVDAIRWLENNTEPREEVIARWPATYSFRLNSIEKLGIQGYFDQFKATKRSDGYILLDMDFEALYPGSKDNLFSKWPRTAEGLIHVAKKSTSPAVLNFLETYRALIDDGNIEVLALLLLPLLLGTVRVKGTTGGTRNPSRLEISQLFLLHVESLEDVQLKLEARALTLMTAKQTIQPFPVLIGPICNLVSSRVIINSVEYDLCSPIKAVDTCFKSFFALNAKYQEAAANRWMFLENYIYALNRPSKKYAGVTKLICALDAYFATQKSI